MSQYGKKADNPIISDEERAQLRDFEPFDITQPLPEEYRDPPGRYRWLKNGAIYDNERSRFVSGKYIVTHNTPERAHLLNKIASKKRVQAQMAAQKGMAIAIKGDSDDVLAAWGEIVGAQATHATAWDQEKLGSSSVRAAEFVGRATGFLANEQKTTTDDSSNTAQRVGAAFIEAIAARMGIMPDGLDDDDEVIDGMWSE